MAHFYSPFLSSELVFTVIAFWAFNRLDPKMTVSRMKYSYFGENVSTPESSLMELWWEFFEEKIMSKGELTRLRSCFAGSLSRRALSPFPVSDPLEVTRYPHCGQSSRHPSPNQARRQLCPHCSHAHTTATPTPQLRPHCSWGCTSSFTKLPSPVVRAGLQHKRHLGVALKELTTWPRQRPCSPVAFLSGFYSRLGFLALRESVGGTKSLETSPWGKGAWLPLLSVSFLPTRRWIGSPPPTLLPPLCTTFCLSL